MPAAAPALAMSPDQFRLVAENMPVMCWLADATGHIFWYNRRWYEFSGTSPAEMEGWGWQALHDPVTLGEVLKRWKASLATGEPFEMVVNRRRKVTPDRRPKLTPPPCEARTVALAPAELVGVAQPGRARFGEVQATLVGQARFLKRRALVPSGRCAVNLGRSRGAERWPGVQ